ncbi:MAG: acyl carrier protein phosphodiesterase [Bacteroidota bacterium]
MNFLAHLFLSCETEELIVGNMIADFIRNREMATYHSDIQKGVLLHRQIDTYTDQHPKVLQGVHRLRPRHRKYAPVVIDILYDHLLSKNWSRYSGRTLQEFADAMYEVLRKHLPVMPVKLQNRLVGMIDGNWLVGYGSIEGLRYTLERMDQRTRFPSNFAHAIEDLQQDYGAYESEFNAFFPEVITFVEQQCRC